MTKYERDCRRRRRRRMYEYGGGEAKRGAGRIPIPSLSSKLRGDPARDYEVNSRVIY